MPRSSERFLQNFEPSASSEVTIEQLQAVESAPDKKLLRRLERRTKRVPRLIAAMTGIALAATAYWIDVAQHEAQQEAASIDINVRGEALSPINSDSALIFLDGFGTFDANILAKYLGPVAQQAVDGQIWSVSYGNAPLNPENISERVIELAEQSGVDRISIVGYSAGGIIGTEVAEHILEDSDLKIDMLMPISTPDGTKGLRPARQEEMRLLDVIGQVPGAEYSTPLRFIGEMYFRSDQFDRKGFFTVAGEIAQDLGNPKLPGMWLMADQTLAIANADLEARFAHIAELTKPGERPIVVYLGTDRPGYDYMVDHVKSSEAIADYAAANGMEYEIFNVPGAIHTRPDLANDEYMETVTNGADEIQQALNREAAKVLLKIMDEEAKAVSSPKA